MKLLDLAMRTFPLIVSHFETDGGGLVVRGVEN